METYLKNILEFPNQLTTSGLWEANLRKLKNKRFTELVIVGMGGSGLAGEILKGLEEDLKMKISIVSWKDYGIPQNNLKNPLYVFVSFSGDTEETISGLKLALKSKKRNLAVITTGDELKKLAEEHRLPMVFFSPDSLTPRQAVGKMFYSLIKILKSSGSAMRIPALLKLKAENYKTLGQELAKKLKNHLIVIYSDEKRRYLGYIWKIKLNETSKALAFNNALPEMSHNEIVGFERVEYPVAALFLEDNEINEHLRKKYRLSEKVLQKRGVSILKIKLQGKSELEKAWRTIILADWTSYFLAKLNRVDPAETKTIDELKELMRH